SLSLDERIANGEILREAHERVVYRLIAVRMKLADDVTDDARALLESRLRIEAQLAHRMKQAAVNRLQSIARIWKRALRDRGERVGKVTLAERLVERRRPDVIEGRVHENARADFAGLRRFALRKRVQSQ